MAPQIVFATEKELNDALPEALFALLCEDGANLVIWALLGDEVWHALGLEHA